MTTVGSLEAFASCATTLEGRQSRGRLATDVKIGGRRGDASSLFFGLHKKGVQKLYKQNYDQTSRKCCSAAALLRAEQVPCEPNEDFVSKFGEQ